jgi:benzylsuccinate CoA-transferase BbsE subunit
VVTGNGAPAALEGVRVIDLTDELGAYAGRLLVDLGAEVIRVEPPGGSRTRHMEPLVDVDGETVSAFELFVNAGKQSVVVDIATSSGIAQLEKLIASADVVIESPVPVLAEAGISADRVRSLKPDLTRVIITPYGLDRQPAWPSTDDLLVMASGGLLHLGGYPDLGPVAAYGGQSRFAASIFGAVAVMAGLLQRDLDGSGSTFDVSAQECMAQALEDSAVTYALNGRVRERQGDRPREAGSGVYPCRDGYISLIAGRLGTARAWAALVAWLNEVGAEGAGELLEPDWSTFAFRQTDIAIEDFGRIFAAFTATRDKLDLYTEAQARMISLSPVSTVADILANPQLQARDFFVDVREKTGMVTFPRAPYRMSGTPVRDPGPAPAVGADTAVTFGQDVVVGGAA